MKKRMLSIIMAFAIAVQLCSLTALAAAGGAQITDPGKWKISGTQYETFDEAARAYALAEPGGSYADFPLAGLLAQVDAADKEESILSGGAYYCRFPNSLVAPYLPEGITVSEVFIAASHFYVTYGVPGEGDSWSLAYLDYLLEEDVSRLEEVSVRGEVRDSLVSFTREGRTVEVNLLGRDSFAPLIRGACIIAALLLAALAGWTLWKRPRSLKRAEQ